MDNRITKYNKIAAIAILIALPAAIYLIGDFPRRTWLKEIISLLTIWSFFIMISQFYLSRANRNILRGHKMAKVLKWHKALGYIFVGILIFHPFLIVFPRYFEAGISPLEAFNELLLNLFKQNGLILGFSAWIMMIVLGLTSFFRDQLPFTYMTWRLLHGYLSIAFILSASFHVVNMGRHINRPLGWLIGILTISAVVILIQTYIFKSESNKKIDHA